MATTNFGWFDNRVSCRRELWCVGVLRLSWPQHVVEGSSAFAPWGAYPDLPPALAEYAEARYGAGDAATA